MTTLASLITTEELAQLKLAVLNSVLNDKPFPGSDIILRFPDLPFVLTQTAVYLADEEVKETVLLEKLNKPLQLVTEEKLKEITTQGKTIFFKFRPEKAAENAFLLSLDASVYSSIQERTSILSSLRIKFQKEEGSWVLKESPTFLSA